MTETKPARSRAKASFIDMKDVHVSMFDNGHDYNIRFGPEETTIFLQYNIKAFRVVAHETAYVKLEGRTKDTKAPNVYKLQVKRGGAYSVVRVGRRTLLQVVRNFIQGEEYGSSKTNAHFYEASGTLNVYDAPDKQPVDRDE